MMHCIISELIDCTNTNITVITTDGSQSIAMLVQKNSLNIILQCTSDYTVDEHNAVFALDFLAAVGTGAS